MDAIKTTTLTPTRVIARVLDEIAKAVPTGKTSSLGSTATTAANTPNPFGRAYSLPRFAR